MKILIVLLTILLVSCSSQLIRWDETQASAIVTFRQDVDSLNCTQPLGSQLDILIKELNWLQIYSNYKNSTDIITMINSLQSIVREFAVRERFGTPISLTYCMQKKQLIGEEIDIVGHTIKGSIQ
jgi:hypothetical protein